MSENRAGADATHVAALAHMEALFDRDVLAPIQDFQDPSQEWRRLFSELLERSFWSWSRVAVG
jgi:hypothetical protein